MLCSKILVVRNYRKDTLIRDKYISFLKFIINKKLIISLFVISTFGLSIYLFKFLSKELSPREDRGAFF